MPGARKADVVVIGGGASGMVVAATCAARGLGVIVLEAGPWLHPQRDLSGDEWDMLNPFDGLLRWGPPDRSSEAWPRELEGIAWVPQVAAIGGTGLMSWGASPRATVGSIEHGWPIGYRDLVDAYERVEEALPVRVPTRLAPKDEAFVAGCRALRIDHLAGPDTDRIGWRLQPSAILPFASTLGAFPEVDGCTACGGCIAGCRNPEGAPLERTAMRTTSAAYAASALQTGLVDLRTGAHATELIHESGPDGTQRVRAVRYRTDDGKTIEQDGERFVLAGGAIETPRLYLGSRLPDPGVAGRYLTCHHLDLVSGMVPREIDPSLGPVSMARCEFPGFGALCSLGLSPMLFALASSIGAGLAHADGPWATSGSSIGATAKRRLDRWSRTLTIGVLVEDEPLVTNGVALHAFRSDDHGRIPRIRYVASDETIRRRDWLARRAGEVLIAAGAEPDSIHRSDLPPILVHAHGTMRTGIDPARSMVDPAGRCHAASNLFIADTSVFADAIGGMDPTLTAQAFATRVADTIYADA